MLGQVARLGQTGQDCRNPTALQQHLCWLLMVMAVVASCYILLHLVHPTPTACADFSPDLQLALVVYFLPSTDTNTPLTHVVVMTQCNFVLVILQASDTNILLALVQLALCGGGCMWEWYLYTCGYIHVATGGSWRGGGGRFSTFKRILLIFDLL